MPGYRDENPEVSANRSVTDLEKRAKALRSRRIQLDDALLALSQREKAESQLSSGGEQVLASKYAMNKGQRTLPSRMYDQSPVKFEKQER